MRSGQPVDHPVAVISGGDSATRGHVPIRDLSSYVPRLLAGRLASGGPIEDFEWTGFPAAVLLTDISGFTARVERAAAAGTAGLEALAVAFNTYFSDLVGVVYGHTCIGVRLASLVGPVAIGKLLDLPGLAVDGLPQWQSDPYLRGLANLPMRVG